MQDVCLSASGKIWDKLGGLPGVRYSAKPIVDLSSTRIT